MDTFRVSLTLLFKCLCHYVLSWLKTNQTKHFKCSKQFQINPFAHTKTQLSCPWQCSCLSPFCNTSNPLLCVSIIEFYHTRTRINFVCTFICRMLHSRASPIYLACLSTDGLNWINCTTGERENPPLHQTENERWGSNIVQIEV